MSYDSPPQRRSRRWGSATVAAIIASATLIGIPASATAAVDDGAQWAGASANPYGGTDYFVDASGGDDAASGTSPEQAWQSLARASAVELQPGDRLLLKGGETWSDQQLLPQGSGTADKPIIIDAYGAPGDGLPYIATNGKVQSPFASTSGQFPTKNMETVGLTGSVSLRNQEYIEIANLELSNDDDFASDITSVTGHEVRDGVSVSINADLLEPGADTVMDGIVVRNLYVHDIDGPSSWQKVHYGGVNFQVFGSKPYGEYDTGGHYFRDIRIEENTFRNVELHAVQFGFNWFGDRVGYNDATGKFHEGWEQLWVRDRDLYSRDVYIGHNYAESIGQGPFQFANTKNLTAEYNEANGWLERYSQVSAGLYLWAGADSVMRYNEIHDGPANQYDATPWDLEFTNFNVTYEHNYSHDNQGGWMAYMGNSSNSIARYNLSVNDNGVIWKNMLSTNYSPTYVLNNVFVYDGAELESVHDEVLKDTVYFANNVFYNTSMTPTTWAAKEDGLARGVFANNAYYEPSGDYSGAPQDATAVYGDPEFTGNPADYARDAGVDNILESASLFTLKDSSPLIDAGRYNKRMGTADFFGDPTFRGDAPDIGIHETANGAVVSEPVDEDPIEDIGADHRIDLALGKKAAASSTHPHNGGELSADKLVDGNPATRWAAADDATYPITVEVDFGERRGFDEIVLDEYTDSGTNARIKDFALERWDEQAGEWVVFHTGQDGVGHDASFADFGRVTSPKVRLSITSLQPGEIWSPTMTRFSVYDNGVDAQPTVSPETALFDRNPSQAEAADNVVQFQVDADGGRLDAIRYVATSGAVVGSLSEDEYELVDSSEGLDTYRLAAAFFEDKLIGTSGLVFEFSSGDTVRVSVEVVDSTALEGVVVLAERVQDDGSEAYDALQATLADAREILARAHRDAEGTVTQAELDDAAAALNAALEAIEHVEGQPSIDAPSEAQAGSVIDVALRGFASETEVRIELHSEPVDLGSVTTDADGAAEFRATIPEETAAGEHMLIAYVGGDIVATSALTVTASAGGVTDGGDDPAADADGDLAATGGDIAGTFGLLLIALAAIAGGVLMTVRRSRAE